MSARRDERSHRVIPHKAPAGATASIAARIGREPNPIRKVGLILGPGFITGASDDDPSGIGTYAVAGASLGLATLWTALLTFPLMAAVQNICARLALVSGRGLAGVLRRDYPRPILYGAVLLLFVANTINVGADLAAVADSFRILTGIAAVWLVVPIALGILAVQIAGSYRIIADVFKWLTLALLAYVVDSFIVRPDLGAVLRATVVPTVTLDPAFLTTLVAVLGTTISPYLFFWQSNEEVEEEIAMGKTTVASRRRAGPAQIRYATLDTNVGMAFSNLVMYFIILATGLTLFPAGKTDIKTGTDAAEALRPLAGDLAGILFAVGMIGAGLLAVPILSGSAAYAICEAFGWRYGLEARWDRAKPFYGVIVVATLLGVAMSFLGIDPIAALFWTAVLNGVIAPPLLVLVMHAASDRKIMGDRRIGPVLTALGWLATIGMVLALAGLAYTTFFAPRGQT
jgi:NRAMP (natural resistance-associated macrophage protein)-like metal ion transporter